MATSTGKCSHCGISTANRTPPHDEAECARAVRHDDDPINRAISLIAVSAVIAGFIYAALYLLPVPW